MRRLAIALLVVSCAPSAAPPKLPSDAWRDLGDELCKTTGASGFDDVSDVIELPREAFFDDGSATMKPSSRRALVLIAEAMRSLPPNMKLLVRSTLEDAAAGQQSLSTARANAIVSEL